MDGWCYGVHCQNNKKGVKVNCQRQNISAEALSTFLTEVERITNSCPLTAANIDINDLEPITPNHVLIGKASPDYMLSVPQEQDISIRKTNFGKGG